MRSPVDSRDGSRIAIVAVIGRFVAPADLRGPAAESTAALLQRLVRARVLDRVSARAAYLASIGEFDPRDLKQLVPAPVVRAPLAVAADRAAVGPAAGPAALPPGTAVGRFVVGPPLHAGPHGTVYSARHGESGLPAAVKVAAAGPAAEQLAAEGAALAAVAHPNVVRLWDTGRVGGSPYVVLERLGASLRGAVARGPVRPARAFRFARDTVRGLRAAYRAGWTHGDVKPGNLLRGADGRVRVADFGLARPVGAGPSGSDRIVGSWPYLAPERFEGGGDHRADVYALGLTLYHLLAGRTPVPGVTPEECRKGHRALALEPLHWWLPDVSRAASALVLKMAAREADDRPGDYDTLLADLIRLSPRGAPAAPAAQPRPRS
jgi:hypothetical protein